MIVFARSHLNPKVKNVVFKLRGGASRTSHVGRSVGLSVCRSVGRSVRRSVGPSVGRSVPGKF